MINSILNRFIYLLFFVSFALCLPMGCGGGFSPNGSGSGGGGSSGVSKSWGFDIPGDYTFNSSQVEVTGSAAKIKLADYTVDTTTEFAGGALVGTVYSGGYLSLDPLLATNELSAASTPEFSSLVGYWNFEAGFADTSVETNNGTGNGGAVGDTTIFKAGLESVALDGAGDYISVTDDDSLDLDLGSTFTISSWVRFNDLSTTSVVLSKACHNGTAWENTSYIVYRTSINTMRVNFSSDGAAVNTANSTTILKDSIWYHTMVTYDGANLKIFINGKEENSAPATGNVFNSTTDLYIGGRPNGVGCAVINFEADANIDDTAIWKKTLSPDEVLQVYDNQKQKYFGFFDSEVFNSGIATSPWPSLGWEADLPYLKELVGDVNADGTPDSESSSDYPSIVGSNGATSDNNLMSSLILLYRFNGVADYTGVASEVVDYSGLTNHGAGAGGNISSTDGLFYQSRIFDGTGKRITVSPFISGPEFTEDKVISFWVKLDPTQADISATTNTIVIDGDGTRVSKIGIHNQTALASEIGKLFVENTDGAATVLLTSTKVIGDGELHHILVMHEGGNLKLFIDGEADGSIINSTSGVYGGAYVFGISATVEGFSGEIDELAYWKRELHPSEIKQLSRRGANRVKTLIKSCADPSCNCRAFNVGGSTTDCDGDLILNASDDDDTFFSTWLGANNTAEIPFSELHNNTSISASGEGGGVVNRESPALSFSDFLPAGLSLANNQYAQFRTILESSDESTSCLGAACMPQVSLMSLGLSSFYGGVVEINNTVGYTYSKQIESATVDEVGGVNCSFNYQVSNNNGITWYYHNGVNWATATLGSHITTTANFLAGIPTFHSEIGTGIFKFKAFIQSLDVTTDCYIDKIDINL